MVMNGFLQNTLTHRKVRGLFVNTALGNFAGYLTGSMVTLVTTYHSIERRALSNLFGLLPRRTIVVHILPEWLEWMLSLFVGFFVMEFVRYVFNEKKYLVFVRDVAQDERLRLTYRADSSMAPGAAGV
jgi:hypothetical protein